MKVDFNLKNIEGMPSFFDKYFYHFNKRSPYKFNYKATVQYEIEQWLE